MFGELEMAKSGYVAPSREGLVPLTIYVRKETRQALKLAALTHDTTVAAILDTAIDQALKRYGGAK
jgi:hypothetical protein